MAELDKVPFVEINGSVASGKSPAKSSITLSDVVESHALSSGSSDSEGTVTVHGNPAATTGERFTGTVRFVVYDARTWVDGGDQFWSSLLRTSGHRAAEITKVRPKLVDRWIELMVSSTSWFDAATGGLIDPRGFALEFLHDSVSQFVNKGEVSVDHTEGVELATTSGGAIDLRAFGKLLPLEVSTVPGSPLVTRLSYSYPTTATIDPPIRYQGLETVLNNYETTSAK